VNLSKKPTGRRQLHDNIKQTPNKYQTKIVSFCSLFVWSQIPKNGTGYAQCSHKPNKRLGRIVLTAP
jgi:hypothetical protein